MNPKKTKEKERRRARKLAEEAWEAANEENLDLAEKIIRRAVATQPENPVFWNDQGRLLGLRGKEQEAEESFRAAISLAPTFAEPFAHLAELRARQGYLRDAIRFMEQAVVHAPQSPGYAQRLQAYRVLLGPPDESPEERPAVRAPAAPEPAVASVPRGKSAWSQPLTELDWADISARITRDGCVLIPALVQAATCAELRGMFDEDSLFAKTVVMDRAGFGQGVYRYFRAPIPATVAEVRRGIYPWVAGIANGWQRLLNEVEQFPANWEDYRGLCAAAGQSTPTPILLKYGPGGFNALHRDLRGSMFFPIQMAVVLSPLLDVPAVRTEGFRGGEFLFCDVPERKKAERRIVPAGLGDTLLFATRDRLVRVGGAYGLQPVKHGVSPITEGSRFVLGVPFHDYR